MKVHRFRRLYMLQHLNHHPSKGKGRCLLEAAIASLRTCLPVT